MDPDWDEVARLPLPPPGVHAVPTPVASMAFDTSQELFWAANEYGRVSSYYGSELSNYTSFKAHSSAEGPVRQILTHDKGIIALGAKGIHMARRTGPPIWHLSVEEMRDLRCMSFTTKDAKEILVAGLQDVMFIVNVDKGEITKTVATSDHYTIMRRSRYICAATKNGSINILDSNFDVLKTWNAHAALINDMDAQHDFIVTCGYSLRQQQSYMLDPLVNVFDLKNMQSLPPIPFPAGAAYVRMHPKMSTTTIIISQMGQMHIVDLMNVNTSNVRQAHVLTYLNMFEIAPSGEAYAMADAECNVHLWGSPSRIRFADLSNPTEFADPVEEYPPTGWDESMSFNSIGMPYYRDTLLSSWPSHMISEVGAPPAKIDAQTLASMTVTEWGGYVRNNKSTRRNQVENTRLVDKSATSLQAPKFLSEKARESAGTPSIERRISDAADALSAAELSSLKAEVPVMYRNVEIKYSKFGVDDFDFGFYNKTQYSGLEIHISNSYANPLLQIMHFTPIIRNIALQHASTGCVNELCLLCELGYLFDMLEKAEGSICQATNLLKTFSSNPQAGPLGVLEENAPGTPLSTLLQRLNRFLLDRITQDYRSIPPHSSTLDQILATSATSYIRCTNCRSEHTKPYTTLVNDLIYPPPKPSPRNNRLPKVSFSQVLKLSIEREIPTRGWCNKCMRYQTLAMRNSILGVPAVLMLNAAITSPEAKQHWGTPGWLPDEIGIIVEQGQVFCYEGEDLKLHLQRGIHSINVYSLIGIAADVDSGQHQKSHLVSLINVAHSTSQPPEKEGWHLFNDFLVRPVVKDEALTFNTAWKLPSVICYQLKAANNHIDDSWKTNLDTSLLYIDTFTPSGQKTFQTLDPVHEHPGPGTIIAIDTEFVSIRQPEIEINSDGNRETIRPTVYALARVSVIRGPSPTFLPTLEPGTPFIDDYINTTDPIVDYLTSYSGIKKGDLDPNSSPHNVVPLKIAYKKLWLLLNLGCTFLGHGLKQDFRVINIHVPKPQVLDTAEYFFVAARLRKLSLAFLTWFFFKEDIQLGTHDSIEDARATLKLYGKYLEFVDAGVLDVILADIYRRGRELGFKAPQQRRRLSGEDASPVTTPGSLGKRSLLPQPASVPIMASASASGSVSGSGSVRVPLDVLNAGTDAEAATEAIASDASALPVTVAAPIVTSRAELQSSPESGPESTNIAGVDTNTDLSMSTSPDKGESLVSSGKE